MDDLKIYHRKKFATGGRRCRATRRAIRLRQHDCPAEATPSQMGGTIDGASRCRGETVDENHPARLSGDCAPRMLARPRPPGKCPWTVRRPPAGVMAPARSTSRPCGLLLSSRGAGRPPGRQAWANRAPCQSRSGPRRMCFSLAFGVRIDIKPEHVGRCVAEAGIGFMFAPHRITRR